MAELRNSFHRFSSWGRTRCPKNIIDSDHQTPVSVVLTGAEDAEDPPNLLVQQSAAFITENQRFLHVQAVSDSNCTLQVQVYMHASGQWANLDAATLNVTSANTHKVFEIFGVDQVRFVITNLAAAAECTIFPACSTF